MLLPLAFYLHLVFILPHETLLSLFYAINICLDFPIYLSASFTILFFLYGISFLPCGAMFYYDNFCLSSYSLAGYEMLG